MLKYIENIEINNIKWLSINMYLVEKKIQLTKLASFSSLLKYFNF